MSLLCLLHLISLLQSTFFPPLHPSNFFLGFSLEINSAYLIFYVGLWVTTECGRLLAVPGEIVVIPQGFRFVVDLPDGPSRGYVAEIFGAHFQLPDLGPIGEA